MRAYVKGDRLYMERLDVINTGSQIEFVVAQESEINMTAIANMIGISVATVLYWVNKLERWGIFKSRYAKNVSYGCQRLVSINR